MPRSQRLDAPLGPTPGTRRERCTSRCIRLTPRNGSCAIWPMDHILGMFWTFISRRERRRPRSRYWCSFTAAGSSLVTKAVPARLCTTTSAASPSSTVSSARRSTTDSRPSSSSRPAERTWPKRSRFSRRTSLPTAVTRLGSWRWATRQAPPTSPPAWPRQRSRPARRGFAEPFCRRASMTRPRCGERSAPTTTGTTPQRGRRWRPAPGSWRATFRSCCSSPSSILRTSIARRFSWRPTSSSSTSSCRYSCAVKATTTSLRPRTTARSTTLSRASRPIHRIDHLVAPESSIRGASVP